MINIKEKYIMIALILIGICFIAIGVFQGETEQVYRKAINICMECIGLG